MANTKQEVSPPLTAGISPEKFPPFGKKLSRVSLFLVLAVILISGFSFRIYHLGDESLSEDELNKLQTVAEYRDSGITSKNGEHPFLMKGLQTVSITTTEIWNRAFVGSYSIQASQEFSLRLPTALFGTFTALLLFLLMREFFGETIGLLTAALWACTPDAIGFDRIAKEDSFLLFFFLLASYFWVHCQTLCEKGKSKWLRYLWLSAVGFGAMIASKYLIHLLAIPFAYYELTEVIPQRKWQIGKRRWLIFIVIMGLSFLLLNPTILLPETWQQMITFGTEKRIDHDAYEFMGTLYRNKITLWLYGVPWYFYYVFILVKTPIITLIFFFVGIPFLFKRYLGDGRFFLFFWIIMWFIPFTVLGGKFTRYFTIVQPVILIIAAIGCVYFSKWLSDKFLEGKHKRVLFLTLGATMLAASTYSSISVAPDYRLFVNLLGGGAKNAGRYFPHDEFYDSSTHDAVNAIIIESPVAARVFSESPNLYKFYFEKNGRRDIESSSLSNSKERAKAKSGDYVAIARGRRYFSNEKINAYLAKTLAPIAIVKLGDTPSVTIYRLDDSSAMEFRALQK